MTLTEGRVTLRPLRVRDEQAWSEIRRNAPGWFQPWDATRPRESKEPLLNFAQMVRKYQARAKAGTMLPWGVHYASASGGRPVFVGQVTVSGITSGSASWGMIGYWIGPRWAGQGIIPLAVAMACDHCFQTVGLHRLEIAIRPENSNSLAVARKLGFRHEGRRQRYMHVDGDWRDHEMFALHCEEVPDGLVRRLVR
ncbi:MAG: GNAT family N-acetyltransferase [Propionibacteriaceae bacterium]|nr:GNAT family N-acetyltransferase [Propionibacteriaceae bacterium]